MTRPRFDPTLIFITDPMIGDAAAVEACVAAAIRGGATAIQLRDKRASDAELIALGHRLRAVTRAAGVPLFVNDRTAVVEAIDADGVHLGQDDPPPVQARRALGAHRLVGLSVTCPAEVATADPALVDYAGVGPVHATATKPDAAAPIGLDGVAALARALPMPAVAIGGLDVGRAAAAARTGVAGIAVVSAIAGAGDPEGATRALRAAIG